MMTSLFTGATGLKSHSTGMSSISDNIANVNTVAFKNAMTLYSDNISTSVNSASGNITGMSQLGLGVSVNVNRTMFQEGSLMAGDTATDLAITGKGFFGVEKDGLLQYTRAGNFRFNNGVLTDPNGFALMGYNVAGGAAPGALSQVTLDFGPTGQGYLQPKGTTSVSMAENLGNRQSYTSDPANPFFGLAAAWNSTATPPLEETQYGYKSSMPIYDPAGQKQNLDVYYDFVGNFDGKSVYQYAVGVDPSVDASGKGGLLGAGTVTFSSTGEIEDMTMFTPPEGGGAFNPATWTPATFDAAGNPVVTANFLSAENTPLGAQPIGLNFGLVMNGAWSSGYTNPADVTANPAGLYTSPRREMTPQHSTSFAGSSGSVTSEQNGFPPGYLKELSVTTDGYLVGKYSNGQSENLYQIPVYRFINEEGLRHEGGNRYSATTESGAADIGIPGTENYGSLKEASLEQSNVDLSREFVNMIVTQRGFQMNSKVVSTSDQLLQKAMEIKR